MTTRLYLVKMVTMIKSGIKKKVIIQSVEVMTVIFQSVKKVVMMIVKQMTMALRKLDKI